MDISEQVKSLMDEYSARRSSLEQEYKKRLRKLCIPYAQKRARFKVGDIIRGGVNILRVDSIGASIWGDRILTAYRGPLLTTKLKERKSRDVMEIVDDGEILITKIK